MNKLVYFVNYNNNKDMTYVVIPTDYIISDYLITNMIKNVRRLLRTKLNKGCSINKIELYTVENENSPHYKQWGIGVGPITYSN